MELDRTLVKSQAKQLLKGRLINVFIITMIMAFIMNMFTVNSNVKNINHDIFNGGPNWEYYDNSNDKDNPIENYGEDFFDNGYFDGITGSVNAINTDFNLGRTTSHMSHAVRNLISNLSVVISVFLAPLEIGIALLYLRLSGNKYDGFGRELDNSFRAAFDKNYIKKVGILLVRKILIVLFTFLLIIPGIIKHYELYFVEFISADKSGLTIGQTNELSKKLTNDHKMELFKLDLSFLGWFLLCGLTFGIALIYVVPYYNTVKALYYQNFKVRCTQEMKISELDYMTDEERTQMYNSQNGYNSNPYANAQNTNAYNQNANYNNSYQTNNPNMNYNNVNVGYGYNPNLYTNQGYDPNFNSSSYNGGATANQANSANYGYQNTNVSQTTNSVNVNEGKTEILNNTVEEPKVNVQNPDNVEVNNNQDDLML